MTTQALATKAVIEAAAEAFEQPVTASDTLFDLGADSLSIVEFLLGLEQRLGISVDPEWLMTGETIGELAAALFARTGSSETV